MRTNILSGGQIGGVFVCLAFWGVLFLCMTCWFECPVFGQRCESDSKVIQDIYLGVTDEAECTNTLANQMLYYSFWTTNRPAVIWYPKDPEYAFRVQLFDTNGASVSKTSLGETIGRRFFDFDIFAQEKGISLLRARVDKGSPCGHFPLFRAADFFRIERPGSYKLRIQFQILVNLKGRLNSTNKICIRYPYLDCTILAPALR